MPEPTPETAAEPTAPAASSILAAAVLTGDVVETYLGAHHIRQVYVADDEVVLEDVNGRLASYAADAEVRLIHRASLATPARAWLDHIATAYLMAPEGSREEAMAEKLLAVACSRVGLDAQDVVDHVAARGVGQLDDDELQRGGS